jgi:hypothetical protein
MSGPERDRLAVLRARAHDALDELRDLRCPDPAAAHAMRVVRLTSRTLSDFWIPALERLDGGRQPDDST